MALGRLLFLEIAPGEDGAAEWEDQIAVLKDRLKAEPGNPSLLTDLGVACLALRRYEKALAFLQRAVDAAPSFAKARRLLGVALARLGRVEEARAEFRRALHPMESSLDMQQ